MRLIWTSDPANTYKNICQEGEVVGLIIGVKSFAVGSELEEALVEVLRRFSASGAHK